VKRILIIGNPGSGKSTLAIEIGKILGLPVIHLDKHFWKRGWIQTEGETWRQKVRELISREEWIMDGNYQSSNDIRFPRADTIIYLDFSVAASLRGIFKRVYRDYNKTRPDMAVGCPERIDIGFLKWAWRFRKDTRPKIIDDFMKFSDGKSIVLINSPKQLHAFLNYISQSRQLPQ
jgi:adenylate kinase family enzyme